MALKVEFVFDGSQNMKEKCVILSLSIMFKKHDPLPGEGINC